MKTFSEKVYRLLKQVPPGRITTYKEISRALGSNCYRAVGNALNKNTNAPQIPCHRVVKSNGEVGGYAFGTEKKIELLEKEGIKIKNGKIVDFEKVLFRF